MDKGPTFAEQTVPLLALVPVSIQPLWKDLIKAVETGNGKKVEQCLDKISAGETFASPGGRELTACLSRLLVLCVREAYVNPSTQGFELYTSLLPVLRDFLSRHAKTPDLKDHVKLLLTLGDRFLAAWYDETEHAVVSFDNFYEFQLQSIRDFISSSGFKAWRTQEGTDEFLQGFISRKLVHLGEFARNRREKPFLNLLDLLMLLLRTVPEFLPAYQGLLLVLPCARKSFWYLYAGEDDGIIKVLTRARQAANPDLKVTVGEWIDVYSIGALPEIPPASDNETRESPELTVPFVYRSLLEEVMGDGTISSEEEWVVKNIRDFVEIPNEKYHRIFEQVLEAKKLQKIDEFDRDFSPRVFLRKILDKTIEDGVISDEERGIISQVANALTLTKETLTEVFQEARQAFSDRGGKATSAIRPGSGGYPQSSMSGARFSGASREIECLHDVVRHIAMEERIRPIIVSDRGIKVYHKAGKMLAALKQKGSSAPGLIATFYFEPQTYLYPVIALFVDTPDVRQTGLRFKGRRIDVEFLEDMKAYASGEETWVEDRPLISLFNDALGNEIPVKAVLVGESLGYFLDALEETNGKFAIMVMHHARMAPILAVRKDGRLDVTGHLAEARKLSASGKPQEALTLLTMIQKGFPETAEVWYCMGEAFERQSALEGNDPSCRQKAFNAFKAECDVDPNSDKSMRAMGRLLTAEGKFEEALYWLEKGVEICPVSVPTLTTLVDALLQQSAGDTSVEGEGAGTGIVSDEAIAHLGEAFRMQAAHPRVLAMIDEIRRLTSIDVTSRFQALPVDPKYQ
ncbi:MAG: hypothetical protein WA705_17865 [Candidatus Ozemobacteraceae bacterium]